MRDGDVGGVLVAIAAPMAIVGLIVYYLFQKKPANQDMPAGPSTEAAISIAPSEPTKDLSAATSVMLPPPAPTTAPEPWRWSTSRVFYGGLVLTAFVMLFPPWQYWINNASVRRTQPALRELIFTPPKQLQGWSLGIDFGRLAVEVGGIALLTAAGLAIRRGTVKSKAPGKV